MGRGATRNVLDAWGVKEFKPPEEPCPDEAWKARLGPHLEVLRGRIVFPLRSPRGRLLGFEAGFLDRKDELRVLLPEARWNPVWLNMPYAMDRIWTGSDVILVEGRADVFAMMHIAGRRAVLGVGTSSLSRRQVTFLTRWVVGRVYVLFDQDNSGRRGAEDAVRTLAKNGLDVVSVRYGQWGDDPGALWDRGGRALMRESFPQFWETSVVS